jgi:hypothetical protein
MADSSRFRNRNRAQPEQEPRRALFTMVSVTSLRHLNQFQAATFVVVLMQLIANLICFRLLINR